MKSQNLKWWENENREIDYRVILHTYTGEIIWSIWEQDNNAMKEMIDGVEDELKKLDEKNGTYTKVNVIFDLTYADLSKIEAFSKLHELATSTVFVHPRGGKVVLVGMNAKNEISSKSIIKNALQVFMQIFIPQAKRVLIADTIEEAYKALHE